MSKYKKKSVKISDSSFEEDSDDERNRNMKEHLRAERTMRNLLNCIEANTYRQIEEQTKCLDGKIEKSFKVFKTTNKI